MKFDKLTAGMIVYDVGRHKMGNTTVSTVSVWSVRIISVDTVEGTCMASWNGNPIRKYFATNIRKWRAEKPLLIRGSLGNARLANRQEIAEHKAKQAEQAKP